MDKIEIVYQNDNLLVVNKPAGFSVYQKTGKDNLMSQLIQQEPKLAKVGAPPRYGLIHRLDKETSGLILIAKNNQALNFFQKQFQERTAKKKYLALVEGHFALSQGKIKSFIGRSKQDFRKQKVFTSFDPKVGSARKAVTDYKTLKEYSRCSLIEASPQTGRKHQIRVHFAWKHHPILGDQKYGFKGQFKVECLKRLFLHAFFLKIQLMNGKEKEFILPLPEDLKQVLSCL